MNCDYRNWKKHPKFPDYRISKDGSVYSTISKKFIKSHSGYISDFDVISLRGTVDGMRGSFNYRLDYLVIETYGKLPNDREKGDVYVEHIDGDVHNCNLNNLRYSDTYKYKREHCTQEPAVIIPEAKPCEWKMEIESKKLDDIRIVPTEIDLKTGDGLFE